jgi:hypothetical protein
MHLESRMKKVLQYFLAELDVRDILSQRGPSRQDRELDIVRNCLVGDHALFLFPGAFCQMTPHEAVFVRFGSRSESSRNYFAFGLNLEDGCLRRALNGIVLLAPHLCSLLNLNGSRSVCADIDASRDDYKRLFDHGVIAGAAYDQVNAVLDLAAAYRSSILDACDIPYCGVPLHFSFDQASFARAREMRAADTLADSGMRYFYDDFVELSPVLVDLAARHQMAQLRQDVLVKTSLSHLANLTGHRAS